MESPEEPLSSELEATKVGAIPGVLVKVAGATIVVAGCVVTTNDVIVV